MNKVILKKISLTNFKGIKSLTLDFNDNTNILGANGSGKTTIVDAFTWLLFGKDSSDRKDFEIKTLDENNTVIPKIDHEVYAVLETEGKTIDVRKILKEKWVKARGAETAEFSGNTTQYFWNDIELPAKEFNQKVSEIVDEKIFKLITSPTAFNSLHWQEKRSVLTELSGGVSDMEIAEGNSDFEEMINYSLSNNISIDERALQLKGSIKKMKDYIKDIPARIDEVYRNMPDVVDETTVNAEIEKKNEAIAFIDNQIQSIAKANEEVNSKIQKNQNKIFDLKSEMNAIEFEAKESAKQQLRNFSSERDELESQLVDLGKSTSGLETTTKLKAKVEAEIKSLEAELVKIREEWRKTNSDSYNPEAGEVSCPCCNRTFEGEELESKVQYLKDKFESQKKNILANITAEGKTAAAKLEAKKELLADYENDIKIFTERIKKSEELKARIEKLPLQPNVEELAQKELTDSVRYSKIRIEIATLEANKFELKADDPELQNKRKSLFDEIIELKESVASNKLITASESRIEELKAEEKKTSAEIAKLERDLFIIENFKKAKIDAVERKVNKQFSVVKFKMFNQQVNGGESETCEALINGVPFSDANTASKINAGIDIINALSEYYGISAPIMIDNRESISEIIPTKSQVINLIVSPEHKKLTIK